MSTEELRARLESLFDTIRSNQLLSNEYVASGEFLWDNNIRLVHHDFRDSFQDQQPPILFESLTDLAWKYPINLDRCKDDLMWKWTSYDFSSYDPSNVYHNSMTRATELAFHIQRWANGSDIPRDIPSTALRLFDLRGIRHVFFPHPLLTEDERFDVQLRDGWDTSLYEFEPRANGEKYPHVILLSEQYNTCDSQSILHGELEVIITAMRNRANQLVEEDEDDDEEYEEEDEGIVVDDYANTPKGPELQFPDERRFPVLMVSTLPPSHARVHYACMDGSQLLIRQSKLLSLDKFAPDTLDFCASLLLSKPLEEIH